MLYRPKYRTIEKPYWKLSPYLLSFTWSFHPKWLLNPISKHKNGKYRSTDIENRVIISHHIGILISKNRRTILNIRVSNTIYYGQPIKARDNVQVFIMHWPFLKLNKVRLNFVSFFRLINVHRLLCAMKIDSTHEKEIELVNI